MYSSTINIEKGYYEKVDFKDQYIPEFSTVVSTTLIASVAATTPLILNAIKPLVKNIIKKLTKKKDKPIS